MILIHKSNNISTSVTLQSYLSIFSFILMAQRPIAHLWLLTFTFRHTTLGRAPLDEGSARGRDFCLTTHDTHKRQTHMTPGGFES